VHNMSRAFDAIGMRYGLLILHGSRRDSIFLFHVPQVAVTMVLGESRCFQQSKQNTWENDHHLIVVFVELLFVVAVLVSNIVL
jgi:hypothetical protein